MTVGELIDLSRVTLISTGKFHVSQRSPQPTQGSIYKRGWGALGFLIPSSSFLPQVLQTLPCTFPSYGIMSHPHIISNIMIKYMYETYHALMSTIHNND